MGRTLYDKIWDEHVVHVEEDGTAVLYIDRHLVHEVTSPQAFEGLRVAGRQPWRITSIVATADHNTPTTGWELGLDGITDPTSRQQVVTLDENIRSVGAAAYFPFLDKRQGIVHVIGPEQGATLPGMTVVCGDSHTSTHGAFGALAFGIGTTEVGHVLATQCLLQKKPKTCAIEIRGKLPTGVTPKDLILAIIGKVGVSGGTGYVFEYRGEAIREMSMDQRMTVCNMSIEGGARAGYVNPDEKTFEYLKGRPYCPKGKEWDAAVAEWRKIASDADAVYDDVKVFEASEIRPTVTWGINPGQGIFIDEAIPFPEQLPEADRSSAKEALEFMKFKAGQKLAGQKIQVAFFGSCTNARVSDFVEASKFLKGRKVAPGIRAIAVPGSQGVSKICSEMGIDKIFREAGFDWREAGCSMCLGMNPDQLVGDEICASSSNRNFKGRQGSPTGRTLLMSPVMVAAAAVTGEVSDARKVFTKA